MSAKIYLPVLVAIVIMLSIITGIMVHRHERRVDQRAYIRTSETQAMAADCRAVIRTGPDTLVCKQFFAQHPGLKQ
jgi:ABC-type transporter Mla maintaining outer membrane lipid asymmetry permease subunit MlaE